MTPHPRIKAVRPIRAKRMYPEPAPNRSAITLYATAGDWRRNHGFGARRRPSKVVGVIDLSDTDALVEQVAHALNDRGQIQGCKETARAVLSSLGLLTPARRRK